MNVLGRFGLELLESRGIEPETAARYGVYTAARSADDTIEADAHGSIIVFPFFEHGVVVNEKFRTRDKRFWQRKGGRKTFWNSDVLDDPALVSGDQKLTITEGEIDGLAAIVCGNEFTVSVPDGAPPPLADDAATPEPIDPTTEQTGKFEFLWNNRDRLRRIKRFVIAVDGDAPGQRLAGELVRRLGAARCMFVTYPEGCKDLDDVLMRHGADAVRAVLNSAKAYPVRGIYKLSEYPNVAELAVASTGWRMLDGGYNQANAGSLMLFAGELMVVTGVPGHGKSTFVLNLILQLAARHGWRTAMFSPEMQTVPHLRNKMRRMLRYQSSEAMFFHDAFIENYVTFIDNDPSGADEEDITLHWLIERARDAVLRDGVRVLVIDPWNEIEHAREKGESMTDYIGRALRALKRFARQYEVAVIIVAHPTKEVAKDGKPRAATLYDIEGSAHWFNKCDHGIVIARANEMSNEATVNIAKVRFEETGTRGTVRMRYVPEFARFVELDAAEYDSFEESAG